MEKEFYAVKAALVKQVLERVRQQSGEVSGSGLQLHRSAEAALRTVLRENRSLHLSHQEFNDVLTEIISDLLGLGPINALLKDSEIAEIMVNGPKEVYVEKGGRLELTDIVFDDEEHLLSVVEKILAPVGRRISEYEPYVDAQLKDGSRVNIIRSPVTANGPVMTIRKFSHRIFNLEDLIGLKTLDSFTAEFLKGCVLAKLNILISGGSSSGKTTLLNVLASFIPEGERVIIIEDTREIHLSRRNSVFLQSRLPTIEGKGEITIRHLLRNALHMRPDRIIIGEVRSEEVLDMVQAMNTGHEGSMTTLHANSSLDSLERLEVLMLLGSQNMQSIVAKRQIISAVDMVVNMERFSDGSRKIAQISEVVKGEEYFLQDIVNFEEETNSFKLTGKVPACYPKLKKHAGYFAKEFESV
ncbi:MAG: CpaF family protein [Candidatus Omnitrophota bacterium]